MKPHRPINLVLIIMAAKMSRGGMPTTSLIIFGITMRRRI